MTAFADSSALVKLYAEEDGSEAMRRLGDPAVSALARVDVPAALWRKHRSVRLSAAHVGVLVRAFEVDFRGHEAQPPRFGVIAAGPAILDDAAALTAAHRLRAYDAVQLASALAARSADPAIDTLACFDAALRDAGVAVGFALAP